MAWEDRYSTSISWVAFTACSRGVNNVASLCWSHTLPRVQLGHVRTVPEERAAGPVYAAELYPSPESPVSDIRSLRIYLSNRYERLPALHRPHNELQPGLTAILSSSVVWTDSWVRSNIPRLSHATVWRFRGVERRGPRLDGPVGGDVLQRREVGFERVGPDGAGVLRVTAFAGSWVWVAMSVRVSFGEWRLRLTFGEVDQ